jgi:RNA polymerase sigma-70 factor (ECF subfamily)
MPRTPDSALLAIENLGTERALALVRRLPKQQAEVILLRVVAGLDTEQVASLIGCTQGAVRVAAHRGLRRLAALLEEAGVTL